MQEESYLSEFKWASTFWASDHISCSCLHHWTELSQGLHKALWVSAGARNIQNIKQNKKGELQMLQWNWTNWQYQGFCVSTAPLFELYNNILMLYCESPSWAGAKCAWPEKCPRATRKLLWKLKLNRKSGCTFLFCSDTDACFIFWLYFFSSPFQWCVSCKAWELGIHKQSLNSHRKSSSPQSSIPLGSSLPKGQASNINSSLHPDDWNNFRSKVNQVIWAYFPFLNLLNVDTKWKDRWEGECSCMYVHAWMLS